jgi:hypothetical protein
VQWEPKETTLPWLPDGWGGDCLAAAAGEPPAAPLAARSLRDTPPASELQPPEGLDWSAAPPRGRVSVASGAGVAGVLVGALSDGTPLPSGVALPR